MRAHTQQNPPGCHEGVGSNGPIGLPPYEVLRLGSPANTGGLSERGARWPVKPKGNERKRKREYPPSVLLVVSEKLEILQ